MDIMNLILELAKKEELKDVKALYNSVINTPYCIWNEEYPSEFEIDLDYKNNKLFVLKYNNLIIGAASIVPENEMDDKDCWTELNDDCEIARIVIHKDYQGKGFAKKLVSLLIEEIKILKYKSIHLAVHVDHIPAYKTYTGLGFKMVGSTFMYGHNYKLLELLL